MAIEDRDGVAGMSVEVATGLLLGSSLWNWQGDCQARMKGRCWVNVLKRTIRE
jgi:hypothetical protein